MVLSSGWKCDSVGVSEVSALREHHHEIRRPQKHGIVLQEEGWPMIGVVCSEVGEQPLRCRVGPGTSRFLHTTINYRGERGISMESHTGES